MKTNLITIELKTEIGNTQVYEVTYMENNTYTFSISDTVFKYENGNIENIPNEVIKFVEDWILEKF